MRQAVLYLDEDELSRILFYIPQKEEKLRRYLQQAGNNIFRWKP